MAVTKYDKEYFVVTADSCKSEIICLMERYRDAVNEIIKEQLKNNTQRVYSSGEIDSRIYSPCRLFVAFDAKCICKNIYRDISAVMSESKRDEIIESYIVKEPVCAWGKNQYRIEGNKLYITILDRNGEFRKGEKRIKKEVALNIEAPPEKLSMFNSREKGSLTIQYTDGAFTASIKYPPKDAEPVVYRLQKNENMKGDGPNWPMQFKATDALFDDLLERGKKNHFPKGLGGILRQVIFHPVIVVKRRKTYKYVADNKDVADCLEVLLDEIDVPFSRKMRSFYTNLEESHMKNICRFYIGSKKSFMDVRAHAGDEKKRRSVIFPQSESYIRDVIKNGNPYLLDNASIHPFVVSESLETNKITIEDKDIAYRFDTVLMENKIEHTWKDNTFTAKLSMDDLMMIRKLVGPLRKAAVPSSVFKEYVNEEYGIIISNVVYSAVKAKYGFFYNRSSKSDQEQKKLKCSFKKEAACLKAFVHFGMMTEEEANKHILELTK